MRERDRTGERERGIAGIEIEGDREGGREGESKSGEKKRGREEDLEREEESESDGKLLGLDFLIVASYSCCSTTPVVRCDYLALCLLLATWTQSRLV